MLLFLATSVGCSSTTKRKMEDPIFGASYKPGNVMVLSTNLPPTLKRVAVLALSIAPQAQGGSDTMPIILHGEVAKLGKFETIFISPSQLQRWFNRESISVEDKLPPNFFEMIREQTGAQGVLFCRLTRYQPYPPIAVGWNMRLVTTTKPETLWAADEVFDAGDPTVSNAARRFQRNQQMSEPHADSHTVLVSPRMFGQYALASLLATIPGR